MKIYGGTFDLVKLNTNQTVKLKGDTFDLVKLNTNQTVKLKAYLNIDIKLPFEFNSK